MHAKVQPGAPGTRKANAACSLFGAAALSHQKGKRPRQHMRQKGASDGKLNVLTHSSTLSKLGDRNAVQSRLSGLSIAKHMSKFTRAACGTYDDLNSLAVAPQRCWQDKSSAAFLCNESISQTCEVVEECWMAGKCIGHECGL